MMITVSIKLEELTGSDVISFTKAVHPPIERHEYLRLLDELVRDAIDGAYKEDSRT